MDIEAGLREQEADLAAGTDPQFGGKVLFGHRPLMLTQTLAVNSKEEQEFLHKTKINVHKK